MSLGGVGRYPQGEVAEGRPQPSHSGCSGRGGRVVSPCWSLLLREGGHRGEANALLLGFHRPRGDTVSLRVGGRGSGGVVTDGRRELSCSGLTGHREIRLAMPLVAAPAGW